MSHPRDPIYTRDDDQKWRERVDERVAALTSGETVQDDRLDELEAHSETLFHAFHGQTGHKDDGGLDGDVRDLARQLNELRALMLPDITGNGGIITRLKRLEKNEDQEEKSKEYRWKFWTAFGVAGLSLMGLFIREWPAISERWNSNIEQLTAPRFPVKRAHHRKPHKVVEDPVDAQESVQD